MRITRVVGVLEPGGAQLSLLRLARSQAALGVETRLLAGDATQQGVALARHFGFDPEVMHHQDEIRHSSRQWTPDAAFAEWLGPRLGSADLVHAHMFGAWWAAATSAPTGVPLVASEHNALTWPLGDHAGAARTAARRVDRFFFHGPDLSAFAARLRVEPTRLLQGRSAISVNPIPRPGLAGPRVSFTGRLREDKGPDLLVRAIALLAEPATTYIVGDGPMSRELRAMVDELGLRRTVHLVGWSNEPSRYVAGASVHVVPSREEAWSQSAVTALALGVPVVGTAVDGLPVTLGDRRGVVVPPEPSALAAAIQAALAGRADVDSEAGRRYARTFHPAEVAAAYYAEYQQVLTGAVRVP